MSIAVIAGASGLVGSHLLAEALSDSEISQVIVVVRKDLKFDHPKLKQVIVSDFSHLSLHAQELKGDFYYSCLGTTKKQAGSKEKFRQIDYQAVCDFGVIAKNHDARSFSLISSSGANPQSPFFYLRLKGEVEVFLKKLNLNHLNIFRPGLLVGERKEFGP